MTVIGLDDTDSRERGMCTTYLATRIADAIEAAGGDVHRRLLVRLNPAVEHKTRGNAALAIHTDLEAEAAFDLAREHLTDLAETADERTAPGLVVAPVPTQSGADAVSHSDADAAPQSDADAAPQSDADAAPQSDTGTAATIPASVANFAREAVREFHTLEDALSLLASLGWRHRGWGGGAGEAGTTGVGDGTAGRGRIGALAAIGAWRAFDEWTYEGIAYREFDRCGTPREIDRDSVFAAADAGYPAVWDTVDRTAGEAVCVPNAPGPILYGIRGDDPGAIRSVVADIASEPVERSALFRTNQGTDAHLREAESADPADLRPGRGYRLSGVVAGAPETRRGGHVFIDVAIDPDASVDSAIGPEESVDSAIDLEPVDGPVVRCVAFEPTKRFRDRVRALRPGDRVTVCGEFDDPPRTGRADADAVASGAVDGNDSIGTLKLEKFAVRSLVRTERVTPTCPDCERTMKSAGRDQGYRCRDCGTSAPGKATRPVERALEPGWYEVPPLARRHIAKPLVRGGFDAPVHPER